MVSVIVPVYNTEKYLKETIDSIINQTYTDWEIILIDDGSTDDSPLICDQISSQNDQIYVYHQKNKGLAATRNIGIKMSHGIYLAFIDSDDEIPKNYLEVMVQEIEEKSADIVFCGLRRISGFNIIEQLYQEASYNCDEYYIATYDKEKFKTRSSCTALYKKDIIDKNNILFPEYLLCGEDSIFMLSYISCCNNIITTNKCYYDYIDKNPNSITKSIFFNHYILDREIYNTSYNNSIDKESFIRQTSQRYVDIMIKELVRFVAYSNEGLLSKIKQIDEVINDDLFQQTIIHYKVISAAHSKWIPWFIKKRFLLFTFLALQYRIIVSGYKRDELNIKSIWRNGIYEMEKKRI